MTGHHSFLIGLLNPPSGVKYWMPVIYVETVPYYPDFHLILDALWQCPVSAGGGRKCNFRCIVYNSSFEIVDIRTLFDIVVKDWVTYLYDWATNVFAEKVTKPEFDALTVSYRRA